MKSKRGKEEYEKERVNEGKCMKILRMIEVQGEGIWEMEGRRENKKGKDRKGNEQRERKG